MILKQWYENCRVFLDCHSETRVMVERDFKQKTIDGPFLLAHEFLFLLCNSEDRLATIKRVHRPELVSDKGNINHWELINKELGKH